MVFKNDEESGAAVATEEWTRTYDDLDQYFAACKDKDEWWLLARAMAEDSLMSGFGDVDVGDIMDALLSPRHRHTHMR